MIRIDKTFDKFMDEDHNKLLGYLKNNNIYPLHYEKKIKKDVKEIHNHIYSICLWSNEFDEVPINQKIFLIQMRSDAIQSLYLSLLGFKKPVKLLLRGLIEDILNHLYYYDHKIEYERLETEPKYYQSNKYLWDYLKNQPRMKPIIEETETFSTLKQYYGDLSKYVHSSSSEYVEYINTIDKIYFEIDFFKQYKKEIINISCCINYLLYVFYKVNVEYESELYNYIIKFIPDKYKKSLIKM
ncbi:MAG: hypothetical protein JRJ62_11615 [Deltaproteobacteria bacterium]|nr:hypothetical protein [Deltaproteobacteria bacterium]